MFQYDPITLLSALLVLSLLPFVAIMVTSYVKLVVVFSLVRNALGVQQVPPNMVLNGMAIILTIFIMAPVGYQTLNAIDPADLRETPDLPQLLAMTDEAKVPLVSFLQRHTDRRTQAFFLRAAWRLWPEENRPALKADNLYVLVPAFMVTELTEAFQIGFLLYLPFIVIDLVISNILLAMGMMMVSPMTISLPFKLLLFVMLNGWSRIIEGLVLSYR